MGGRTSPNLELIMNEELKNLALRAGASNALCNELWFNIFCQKFAHLIIEQMELEHDETVG